MRHLAPIALAFLAPAATAHADKSPTVATALSGTGAGVSAAVVVSSFLFGRTEGSVNLPLFFTGVGTSIVTPSLGQIYAGEYWSYGMALRGGAAAFAAIAILGERHTVACDNGIDKNCKDLNGTGIAFLGLAAIAFIGGMAYDVMDAPEAAARANQAAQFSVSLVPTVLPHGGGLGLVGRF